MSVTKKAVFKALTQSLCLLAVSGISCAGPLDFYYQKHQEKLQQRIGAEKTHIVAGYFKQNIDHDNPALGTFSQRYYIDEYYADSPDAPVFFYICGESTCTDRSLLGSIRQAAKKHHAVMVALEHRYYGESIPTKSLSAPELKYLTTDFALRDLANFQTAISKTRHLEGKWIAFGGSYPGSLSAYYRLRYPNLVAGSLASSAPVEAKENFEEYDAHVTKVAGPECAAKMRIANQTIEAALSDKIRMLEIKRSFKVGRLIDNTDFLFFVADIGAAAVQYGYQPTFCKMLMEEKDPLAGYARFANYLYVNWDIDDPMSLTTQGAESEDPQQYGDELGMRQWYYQSCTEYGYWQYAHHDAAKSTRSSMVNSDYFRGVCKRLFDIETPANTAAINQRYYRPLLNESTSNIFFTNGSTDPWSLLSLSETNGNATNKNLRYYTIAGASHCNDLRSERNTDSPELLSAREQLSNYITDWLTKAQ